MNPEEKHRADSLRSHVESGREYWIGYADAEARMAIDKAAK